MVLVCLIWLNTTAKASIWLALWLVSFMALIVSDLKMLWCIFWTISEYVRLHSGFVVLS